MGNLVPSKLPPHDDGWGCHGRGQSREFKDLQRQAGGRRLRMPWQLDWPQGMAAPYRLVEAARVGRAWGAASAKPKHSIPWCEWLGGTVSYNHDWRCLKEGGRT